MKRRRHNVVISVLLLLIGLYIALVASPAALSTWVLGYAGAYSDGRFLVLKVFRNSPADEIGIKEGDVVLEQDGVDMMTWHGWYTSDINEYLDRKAEMTNRVGGQVLLAAPKANELRLDPRPLNVRELFIYFGIRTFLILFLFGLSLVIMLSRTNERSALLICLCFCFAMLWFASDQPYWPQFSSPFISGVNSNHIAILDLMEALSLQLVMGTLLHIALVFPQKRVLLEKHRWLPLLAYSAALVYPLVLIMGGDGGLLLERTNLFYESRLYLNSILLVLVAALMMDNYIRCKQPSQKEQARWIVTALGVIAIGHLLLWNIPIMLTGQPLIQTYNWLLLTFILLPIALTMSMTSHELFGMRGMIRGRIRLLETRLGREKRLVSSRDASIRAMQEEIQRLQLALHEYDSMEKPDSSKPDQSMEKLEQQYPELKEIRKNRLIGVSPAWTSVFEQVVLAARGMDPVLIVGESGTGKTDVARAIHRLGERRDKIYRQVSCAQFEHSDPAFALGRLFGIGTGHGLANVAREGQKGLLEECDGGTLLMDDFDRLPLNVQDLLLYPLEGKAFDPGVGTGPSRSVSVKFIFATNQEPEQLVRQGQFRGDVLARIVMRVDIPPLRQRKEDIPALVENFVKLLSEDLGQPISIVSNKAMHLLCAYSYASGNARELKAELHKAVSKALLEDDHVLRAGYLSQKLRSEPNQSDTGAAGSHHAALAATIHIPDSTVLDALRRHRFQITPAETELGYSHKSKTVSNHLRGMCIQALTDSNWDVHAAARALAGSDDPQDISRLKTRIERLLNRITDNVNNQTTDKLFNNLPTAYHEALNKTITKLAG